MSACLAFFTSARRVLARRRHRNETNTDNLSLSDGRLIMTRYHFDLLDEDGLVVDEEGMEFSDLAAVEREAARAMADAASDSFDRSIKSRDSSIEVRDNLGPVIRVRFVVEIERLRRQ
jgi:hypothetical protein